MRLRATCLTFTIGLVFSACSSSGDAGSDDGSVTDDTSALDGFVGSDTRSPEADAPKSDSSGDTSTGDSGVTDTKVDPKPDVGVDAKPTSGCGKSGAATGDLHLTTTDGKGVTRDFEVLVPASYVSSKPMALTFAYHGAGGDSSASKAFGIQDAPGAAAASIFVFPKGINFETYGVGWDDGCKGYDMVFFDHMLEALESAYCIDTAAVFAAGFSWGCDHVTALTCCRGNRLRAIAAASCSDEFSDPSDYKTYSNSPCPAPTGGTAIRFTHDSAGDGPYTAAMFTSTSKLYQHWETCTGASTATSPSPCVSWGGCSRPVVECPYPSLGHATPAGWGKDTWSFFTSVR